MFSEIFDVKPTSEVSQVRWIGISEDDVTKAPQAHSFREGARKPAQEWMRLRRISCLPTRLEIAFHLAFPTKNSDICQSFRLYETISVTLLSSGEDFVNTFRISAATFDFC